MRRTKIGYFVDGAHDLRVSPASTAQPIEVHTAIPVSVPRDLRAELPPHLIPALMPSNGWRQVSTCTPVSGEVSVAPLSTAAMIEELRHVRPSTQLALDPVFRNADIDFSNLVLGSTIGSSISTLSTTTST